MTKALQSNVKTPSQWRRFQFSLEFLLLKQSPVRVQHRLALQRDLTLKHITASPCCLDILSFLWKTICPLFLHTQLTLKGYVTTSWWHENRNMCSAAICMLPYIGAKYPVCLWKRGSTQKLITFAFADRQRPGTPTFLPLPSDQETLAAVEVSCHKVGLIRTSAFDDPNMSGYSW